MKLRSSLKNKMRDKFCQMIRRGKNIFVINKKRGKFKVKQG
jgi:ribosomal protein L36